MVDTATDTASYQEFAEHPFLSRAMVEYTLGLYLPDPALRCDGYASLLRGNDDFSGLPDALILTGECDVLRDEAAAFAKKLEEAEGNTVQYHCFDGHFHCSMVFNGVLGGLCEGAFDEIGSFLKSAF